MKINTYFLKLFAFLAITTSLNANFDSKTYYSIYDYGFNKLTTYGTTTLDNKIYYLAKADINGLSFLHNSRAFIPNLTSRVSLTASRKGSQGWINAVLSLGQLSSIYDFQGNLKSLYSGQYTIDYGTTSKDSNMVSPFEQISTQQSAAYLLRGQSFPYLNAHSLNVGFEFDSAQKNNLNKWLYIAFDDRPKVTSANPLGSLRFTFTLFFEGDKLDRFVKDNMDKSIYKMHESSCPTNGLKNLCIYIKSFGSDGSSNDIVSHSNTASNYENTFTTLPKKSVNLRIGWSVIGTSYGDIYLDQANWSSAPKVGLAYDSNIGWSAYKNSTLTTQSTSKISQGKGMWIYTDVANSYDVVDKPAENNTFSLTSGWNLLSAVKDTDVYILSKNAQCIQAIYKYNTVDYAWDKWDREIKAYQSNSFNLSANEGFWVKTSSACSLTY